MNENDIKSISIKDYLAQQGIYPAKYYFGYGLYKSPFRDERTPSFKVDYQANIWCDFGTGEGGSIIDLVMKIQQCSFIVATQILQKENHSFFFQRENSVDNKTAKSLLVTAIQPLENPKLSAFLQSRKIDINIAKSYCKEIHYHIGGRNYFAVGFANDAGGFALRNQAFKGCISSNQITTFAKNTNTVHLFEGFLDYLSLLTMQARQADVSTIVLNSVNNLEKAIPFLSKHTQINAFLDNDEGGKRAFEKLHKLNLPVADISKKYSDFKDVNDFLCGNKLAKNQIETAPKIIKNRGLRR